MKKTLVILAVEDTLDKMGEPVLGQVYNELYSKYGCYLSDCYEKPEYLRCVLKDMFGNSYHVILGSIEQKLVEHSSFKQIEEFLAKMHV